VDVARSEAAEAELDRFIEKRSTRQKDPEEQSELWQESVDAYNEKRQKIARLEWRAFHCGQAERHRASLQALIDHHEEQAERYRDQPEGA
jgi:hypothetical protein